MILRNTLNFINKSFENILKKFRKVYLNSDYYEKKISKFKNQNLIYKPSPHLLSSLINYQTKKVNVDNIVTEITAFEKFYVAEDYHQNYYNNNKYAPYCNFVIKPKIEKFLNEQK